MQSVKGVVGHSVTPNAVYQLTFRYLGTEPLLKNQKNLEHSLVIIGSLQRSSS